MAATQQSSPAQLARRLPLIARPRPACLPLTERIHQIAGLADAAHDETGDHPPSSLAAQAHNQAALIASDCGMPDLARTLCWRHHHLYRDTRPLTAHQAQHALEPLVNLARLRIRAGDGDGAHTLLTALYEAVEQQTQETVDGHTVEFGQLTAPGQDHQQLRQWLWAILLADGTRALVAARRWYQAHTAAKQHQGIGQRLLDGRQIAIVHQCVQQAPDSGLELVRDSHTTESWEQAVAACLTALCHHTAGTLDTGVISTATDHYTGLEPQPGLAVFRTRLGLTLLDLANTTRTADRRRLLDHITSQALAANDGYVARDVLANEHCRHHLTDTNRQTLATTVGHAGLGQESIPSELLTQLLASVEMAEATTRRYLTADARRSATSRGR